MVKRPKSPEIIEEARYFTVCQPFPLNANWVFDKDQQDCATWIAECIGLEHLYAIHYKPSARGMILLEVSKLFTEHERLLGEHRWSEILTNPDKEQEARVSQVFHSFYAKGRDAQKDGWKALSVKSSWFKNWVPGKGDFKRPYPQTHWCPVPVEDKTDKQLCRPLPVDKMPPPPRVEPPVVGSATWTQKKMVGKPTVEALKMSWDEEISSTEAVNRLDERAQSKPNAGPSISVLPATTSPTTSPVYPPLVTSAPSKGQPASNLVSLGKNKTKRNSKPVPLSQFIGSEEGSKKSTPATWNKVPPVLSAPPVLNGPLPKPTPRSANAWDRPIKLKASAAPAAKQESPPEDYSAWGQESGTSTVVQENIWKTPLPTQKKSKKGKDGGVVPEIPASSIAQGNTRPSSPQVCNTPAISSFSATRDVPPHQTFRPSEEEEDSDYDDIYIPYSNGKATVDNPVREDMEYVDVNASERGVSAVDSETSGAPAVVEEYQNLWLSEDDPRAIPLPDARLICPTHHIACKKGICEDMSKILRDIKKEKLKAEWEEKMKNKGKKKKKASGSGDNNKTNEPAEVDGDNFTIAGPKGNRGRFGKHQKNQDASEVNEPSYTGRLRAFTPDRETSDHEPDGEDSSTPNGARSDLVPSEHAPDGKASSTPNGGSAPERQLFDQW